MKGSDIMCNHYFEIKNNRISAISSNNICSICGEYVPINHQPPRHQVLIDYLCKWVDADSLKDNDVVYEPDVFDDEKENL